MSDFCQRLELFLSKRRQLPKITQLTPDASTREYFRVEWRESTAIACVYPEAFSPDEQNYLDVSRLFLEGNLPVAKVYDFDGTLGVILLEDFGDTILREALLAAKPDKREQLLNRAICLIAKIQAATPKAYELNSIASRLKFDEAKLLWELEFFKEHYFNNFRKKPLIFSDEQALNIEFRAIACELETHANILTHRDFHAANLMIDEHENLRIIDHQDARIGSKSYDLVSLLLDRILKIPETNWLDEKKQLFLAEREKLNLQKLDYKSFDAEFQLQAVQRCLKAAGTFAFQSTFRTKTHFVQFIKPMFKIVLHSAKELSAFPHLQQILENELNA